MDYPRKELLSHVAWHDNLCLNVTRQTKAQHWRHAIVTDVPAPAVFVELKDGSTVFPLYLYDDTINGTNGDLFKGRHPNLSRKFLDRFASKLGLPQESRYGLPKDVTPEDIFNYIYAVFHSPVFRNRYADFLKRDFPRVPLTADLTLFRALSGKGRDLVALHLLDVEEAPQIDQFITKFRKPGTNVVEKVEYDPATQHVHINDKQFFEGVPRETWDFQIGGYQVCEKWLKDRRRCALSYDDTQHWQRVVVALTETRRLTEEIDELIPGWPLR
jgi:predicted helicase